jgi:5S rRNA maturation endonuclease (ribonuclease M5)
MKEEEVAELQQLFTKYAEFLVVVEGKKDAASLKMLGFTNVLTLEGKALFEVVELISEKTKECIVLTDLDKKGKQLYARITKDLTKHGVTTNNELRNFLFKHTGLRQIEGIIHFLEKHSTITF